VPQNDFPGGGPGKEIIGLIFAGNPVDLPYRFEDQRIDAVMADF